MSYLLALDAGTGSVRAVIFDLQGNQIAVGQAEWKHLSVENVPGSMEFDLNTNWRLTCQCIHQALDRAHLSAASGPGELRDCDIEVVESGRSTSPRVVRSL